MREDETFGGAIKGFTSYFAKKVSPFGKVKPLNRPIFRS
jgi:hypothetical protein